MRRLILLVLMCSALACATVNAQPAAVVNPTIVRFGPSPDHEVVLNGQSVLTGYKVDVVVVAGGAVIQTFDIGKPSPVSGVIDASPAFSSIPNGIYVVDVYPYGPGGDGAKLRSEGQFIRLREPAAASGSVTFH